LKAIGVQVVLPKMIVFLWFAILFDKNFFKIFERGQIVVLICVLLRDQVFCSKWHMPDLIPVEQITDRIFLIRGTKVMLDKDLTEL